MPDPDFRRVEEIFSAAIGLAGPERDQFVAVASAGDAVLQAYVRRLLAAHDEAGGFLLRPTLDHGASIDEPSAIDPALAEPLSEAPGACIGPYKLLQKIGEGGFGSVFMAEQQTPVVRRVALKIIKLGMDTRQVIARFEAERQALAMMDHPNIARVLDAGATETGRPYFVMDLVSGDPIAEYCDKHKVGIEERLELFAQVCAAVQHAHQKGIIHRDIKPSNVLVTVADGRPIPKMIDFGIAKATASRLTEKTLFTEHRQLIGTPQYMSPEQAEGSLDIDTRTDVYSLGVLLYELLTGSTPFTSKELRAVAYAEIQRIIREVEPPKPSTRLSQSTETLASVAAHRHTEPRRLGALVRGELDWIVMKALEKQRDRRYETADGLAMDVRRYLTGEAVVAAPPSATYRFRKFVRRNQGTVTGVAAVAVALLVGLIGFAWQARVARRARDAAEKDRNRAAAAEVETAKRAGELEQVAGFQTQMLSQIDVTVAGVKLMNDIRDKFAEALAKDDPLLPEDKRRERSTALERELRRVNATDIAAGMIDRTILQPAIATIESQFKDQPAVAASLQQTLADLYTVLGRYENAMRLQERALATRRRVLGEEHPDTLVSINSMGQLLEAQGKYSEAEPYLREVLEKTGRALGEEHPDTLVCINNLGGLFRDQGKYSEAEPYLRQVLEKNRRLLGEEHPRTLTSINNMGGLLQAQGKLEEAEPYLRDVLEKRRRVLGEDHPQTISSIDNMGFQLLSRGMHAEAEPYLLEALEKRRHVRGEEHSDTLTSLNDVGLLYLSWGRLAEAEPYCREALEKRRRVLGEEHADTISSAINVGDLLWAQGKHAESEPYYREALEKRRHALGENHPDTLSSVLKMGNLFWDERKYAEAEPYYCETLEKRRRALGEDHADTLGSLISMGMVLKAQAKLAEAEPYFREALEKDRRARGERHPETAAVMALLGAVLVQQNTMEKAVEAEPLLRQCLAIRTELLPEKDWRLDNLRNLLGGALLVQGRALLASDRAAAMPRLTEARPLLVESCEGMNPPSGDVASKAEALRRVVELFEVLDAAEPGHGHDAAAVQWKAKLDATHPGRNP